MNDKSLSQDEVDTLMAGIDEPANEAGSEKAAPAVGAQEPDGSGVSSYDLAKQGRIVRGKMLALEAINKRCVRGLNKLFPTVAGRQAVINPDPVTVDKYSEFIGALVVPSNLNVMRVAPLRGKALIVIEPQIIGAIVDGLFGGDGALPTRLEGRDFSATENRIIGDLLQAFTSSYAAAWQELYPLELEYLRSEMQPQFVSIAAPDERVVTTRFSIELGTASGAAYICIPYSTFEPIRDLLYTNVNADQLQQGGSWLNKLSAQLESANVDLIAEFAQAEISFGELLNLQVGDLVEINVKDRLLASVDGIPFLRCNYGVNGNRYALRVAEKLPGPQDLASGLINE